MQIETDTNSPNYVFPQVRMDQMIDAADSFDKKSLPTDTAWLKECSGGNFDAAESAYIARQLEFMRPGYCFPW